MKRIAHEEIGGGYAMGPHILIDTAEIFPGEYETMAINMTTEEELDTRTASNETDALRDFSDVLQNYMQPLQSAAYAAKMKAGGKYTVFCMNEFGYPVARKITFHSIKCTTYAQHYDAVEILCTPYRKRSQVKWYLYNKSFAIFEGWQNLDDSNIYETVKKTGAYTMRRMKYGCFDARFFEDGKNALKNRITVYEDYKTGVNGKIYA